MNHPQPTGRKVVNDNFELFVSGRGCEQGNGHLPAQINARFQPAIDRRLAANQRRPVTIGMAIEARKSESNETVLGRFVAVGKIFTAQDFIETRKEGRFPAE